MRQKIRISFLLLCLTFLFNVGFSQQMSVTGKVTDDKGLPLPSVNIIVKGTLNGVLSDIEGNYTLKANKGDTLVFSYIGMISQEVIVKNSSVINVSMRSASEQLEAIVVTGYSQQSTRNITGSVSVVDSKKIESVAPINIEQSLQGQASGVLIGSEGGPGGAALVRVRGFGTVNNNDPLYLIDGTPTTSGLNQLNPADIKSVQILKDASSAAIYGFRAANGVIIITTKQGNYGNKSKITFSSNVGVDFVANSDFPKMITPQEMADVVWMRFKNDGDDPSHVQYGNGANPVLPTYLTPAGENTADESTYDPKTNKITKANKAGTNWFDEYFNPALVQNYNLGMSGGSETARFNLGLGVLKQDGVALETFFDRYTLKVNSEFKVAQKIRIGESFNVSYSERVATGANQHVGGDISFLYRAATILPIRDIAGNYAGTQSPGLGNGFNSVAAAHRNKDNIRRGLQTLGSIYAEVDIIDGLMFKTNLSLDYRTQHGSFFSSLNPEAAEPDSENRLNETTFLRLSSTWFNTLNYTKKFGNHAVDVLVGTEFNELKYKAFSAQRSNFFTEALDYRYLDTGSGTSTNGGNGIKSAYFSLFGKVNYIYNDKYLLSLSLRRDETSKFAKGNRAGFFPSYSLAWRISKENFMQDLDFIDDLKIKVGYGELGNESIPEGRIYDLYRNDIYTSNYSISGANSSVASGYNLVSLGNKDLTWETTTTQNIGIDGYFFNKKWNFSFEYFYSKTVDMLLKSAGDITLIGHVTAPYANLGSMENKGFDLTVGYTDNISDDLKFNVSANISSYKNKVLTLTDNPDYFLSGNRARETRPARTQQGHPLASFHGFVIEGIIQDAQELSEAADYDGKAIGTFKYKDITKDGVINDADRTYIGSPHPDFIYALNLGLEYKNFDFSLMLQGSQGNDIYNFTKFFTDYNSFPGGKSYRYLNSWTPDNRGAELPKLTNKTPQHYSSESSYYVEDGSYLRLKNVQLGYNFDKSLTNKIGIGSLRVYVQAKNILTFSKYLGLDPEINLQNYGGDGVNLDIGIDRGAYPIARSVLVGINLTL